MDNHRIVHPITEALRHRRMQRGISRHQMGKLAGIQRNSILAHEEHKFPALYALDKWARSLNFQLVLLDVTPPKNK